MTVASRSRGPIDAVVAQGAADGGSPCGVAKASQVTFLCVPNSPEVLEVVDAMLPVLGPGKTVVDCSTIDPEVQRAQHVRVGETGAGATATCRVVGRHGRRGEGHVDAHGGRRQPTIPADSQRAMNPFAGLVVHVGGPGHGKVAKLCNQVTWMPGR